MSSTEIRKSLERILECPICQDQMRDATLLKCGHSFCKECLNKMVTSRADAQPQQATGRAQAVMNLPCPCCRKGVRIENRSLSKLKPNLMVNSIVDFLNTADQNDKPCSSKSKPGKSWLSMCEKHPNIEKKFACERCKLDVCSECLISDHFNHDGDRPMTLREMKDTLSDVLNKSEDWEDSSYAFESQIHYIREKGTKAVQKLIREVADEYTSRVNELKESKNRMTTYLVEQNTKFTQEIDAMKNEWQANAARIRESRSHMKVGVKRGAPSDVITTYTSYAKRLKKDLSTDTPSKEASSKLSAINTLYFQKGMDTLGRIRHRGGNNESDDEYYYTDVEGYGSDPDEEPGNWSNESVYSPIGHSHDELSDYTDMDERDSQPSSSSAAFSRSGTSSANSHRSSSRNSQDLYD